MLRRRVSSQAARNTLHNGTRHRVSGVPAVTDWWRWQRVQTKTRGRLRRWLCLAFPQ